MARHRFYLPNLQDAVVFLDKEESHHARRVMRIEVGQEVELFDGMGASASAKVLTTKPDLSLEIVERRFATAPLPHITLAVALPKGDRASVLVEKATELGCDALVPLRTERSVVDPREGKLDRLHRIAVEACKQCGRPWLMRIEPPTDLSCLLKTLERDGSRKLIADTPPQGRTAGPHAADGNGRVIVLIGPEGGWTDPERAAVASAGFTAWSFNAHVLRIETAALAALAILRQSH